MKKKYCQRIIGLKKFALPAKELERVEISLILASIVYNAVGREKFHCLFPKVFHSLWIVQFVGALVTAKRIGALAVMAKNSYNILKNLIFAPTAMCKKRLHVHRAVEMAL